MAKKHSVLKALGLRNLKIFSSIFFLYYNFEDTVTNFDKDMFKKKLSNSYCLVKTKFKSVVVCFHLSNCVSFVCCSILRKMPRNCQETLSTQNHKKLRNFKY